MRERHQEDTIHLDEMESDKEWDNIEVKVCKLLQLHHSTPIVTGLEGLYEAVPLSTGRTLGMTLRPRRVVVMAGVLMTVFKTVCV